MINKVMLIENSNIEQNFSLECSKIKKHEVVKNDRTTLFLLLLSIIQKQTDLASN